MTCQARPPTAVASGDVQSHTTAPGRNALFRPRYVSACPANGTVTNTTPTAATASSFAMPSHRSRPAPRISFAFAAARLALLLPTASR